MAATNQLGKEAEELAVIFLINDGFEILHRNWMFAHAELDIVAIKDNRLHFIEVKGRRFYPGCNPEDNVTKKKFRHIVRAAEEYMHQNPGYCLIEFSVLSITFHSNAEVDYFFIRDVFL